MPLVPQWGPASVPPVRSTIRIEAASAWWRTLSPGMSSCHCMAPGLRRRSSLQARGDRPNPRGMPVRPGRRHRDRPVGRGWGAGPAPARGPHWQRGQALDSEAPETSPAHTCKPPKKAIDVDTGHRHVEKNDRRATLRNEVPFNGTTSGSEHGRRGHRTSWARSGGDRRRGVCGRRPPGCP